MYFENFEVKEFVKLAIDFIIDEMFVRKEEVMIYFTKDELTKEEFDQKENDTVE